MITMIFGLIVGWTIGYATTKRGVLATTIDMLHALTIVAFIAVWTASIAALVYYIIVVSNLQQ